MHTQQDSDAALQNNLTISEKSVVPYTHSSGYAIASLILGIILLLSLPLPAFRFSPRFAAFLGLFLSSKYGNRKKFSTMVWLLPV